MVLATGPGMEIDLEIWESVVSSGGYALASSTIARVYPNLASILQAVPSGSDLPCGNRSLSHMPSRYLDAYPICLQLRSGFIPESDRLDSKADVYSTMAMHYLHIVQTLLECRSRCLLSRSALQLRINGLRTPRKSLVMSPPASPDPRFPVRLGLVLEFTLSLHADGHKTDLGLWS